MSTRPFPAQRASASRQTSRKTTRPKLARKILVEALEDRRVMAVASVPDQPLALNAPSVLVSSGHFDSGAPTDLVSVTRNGQVDVALNSNSNSWQTTRSSSPVTGPVLGGATGLLDVDPYDDLVLQTPSSLQVLRSDGVGGWNTTQSVSYAGVVNAATHPQVQPALAYLGNDLAIDFVTPLPQSNQIAIFSGNSAAGFTAPRYLTSGGNTPTVVAIGNVIGGPMVDLIVGHTDGTLVFFEGNVDGSFVNRLTIDVSSSVGSLRSMKVGDFEGDGVNEIVVGGSSGVATLSQVPDPLVSSPIVNGNFADGLTGWHVQAVGQPVGQAAGTIRASSGFAQITENSSFLTTLSQSFVIPPTPQIIEFDLLALGLDAVAPGQIPDAFEVSLLSDSGASLVPTHKTGATAFVNYAAGSTPTKGAGVTITGTHIQLDITGVAPGTRATLLFDVIGNPNGTRSTVSIDNVHISPEVIRNDSFIVTPLAGPFASPRDVEIGDVDGDGHTDIVITDESLPVIVVFNGNGASGFTRSTISTPSGAPSFLTLGTFTAPDSIVDIAYALAGAASAVTPLVNTTSIPTAQLVSPATNLTIAATESAVPALGSMTIQFSESMLAGSTTQAGSASNPTSYRFYNFGPDGIDNQGTGDDKAFTVTGATYNGTTKQVVLSIDSTALANPTLAAGSLYRVVAVGADPVSGLRNLAGTRLDNGQDFSAIISLTRTPSLAPIGSVTANEGSQVSLSAALTHNNFSHNYVASIDWGDGSLSSITGNDALNIEQFSGTHVYADNGAYLVTITVSEGSTLIAESSAQAVINNVSPSITPAVNLTAAEGSVRSFTLGTFSDPGFTRISAGTSETFTGSVNWGDGSPVEAVTISVVAGSPGVATIGTITGSHLYQNNGTYNATLQLSDDDNGTSLVTVPITVSNVAPTISLSAITANEGAQGSFTFTAVDPGLLDNLTATVQWGDGTSTTNVVGVISGTTRTFTTSHTYADNATYPITVSVNDGANTGSAITSAVIASVAPTVLASPANTTAGQVLSVSSILISDPGFATSFGNVETFTATIDWGDGTGVQPATVTNLLNGSIGTATTARVSAQHTFTTAGTYSALVRVTDDDGAVGTRNFDVTVAPAGIGNNACLPAIDFETNAAGTALATGTIVAEQWASWGLHVTSQDPVRYPPRIMNSAKVTWPNQNLGSPNMSFGGPGVGTGGATGSLAENRKPQKNILIVGGNAEYIDRDDDDDEENEYERRSSSFGHDGHGWDDGHDHDHEDGDDKLSQYSGGTLIFRFDYQVQLDDVTVLDIAQSETVLFRWYDAAGIKIGEKTQVGIGTGNGLQSVALNARAVRRLEVKFSGTGAITDIAFCRDLLPGSTIQIAGASAVSEGQNYQLNLASFGTAIDSWSINWGDGTFSTAAGLATIATHVYADGLASIPILATAKSGNSVYLSNTLTVTVNNVIPTLTISGANEIRAGKTYTLNLSETDPGTDTIQGWLIDWGDGTRPQTIAGNPSSVTHLYANTGTYSIKAHAYDEDFEGLRTKECTPIGSLLRIKARGDEGGEAFELLIDDVVVKTFTATTQFQHFSYASPLMLTANQIKIRFTNDVYNPSAGIDNNLIVDYLKINDELFQTEANDVWSTGTWKDADGVQPGFRNSEWLTNDGYFHFDHDANDGTSVKIKALGSKGDETFNLSIGGQVVATYTATTAFQTFEYRSPKIITADQLRISFTNDLYDTANNIDRNLMVDYVALDGTIYQTEHGTVYSTGTWQASDGITAGYRRSEWLHANGYFQYANLSSRSPFATAWVSNTLSLSVVADNSRSLPKVDFERDAAGNALTSGTRITNQFQSLGMTVSTDNVSRPAMIFNSAAPTGLDYDLGTPNSLYFGPGIGIGGGLSTGANTSALRNVLIISKDNSSTSPNDNEAGGTLTFNFASDVRMDEIHLLDIDTNGTRVRLYDTTNSLISDTAVPNRGDNSFQIVAFNASGVRRMEVVFSGGGAVAAIISNRASLPITPPQTTYFVADTNDTTYRYTSTGVGVGNFALPLLANARGATTTTTGNPLWILSEEGLIDRIYVYDTSTDTQLGSWTPTGVTTPEGIATDGNNIWLVDDATNKMVRYSSSASRRSGSLAATSSFNLATANGSPKGVTTDGTRLFVVDPTADKVFVYSLSGTLLTSWGLDPANGNATDITLQTGESGLATVDATTDRIYYYPLRMPGSTGIQTAQRSFPLASANGNAQGLADPAIPFNIGEIVSGSTTLAGEQVEYTFNATAGQTLYFDVSNTNPFQLNWKVTNPDGSTLFINGFMDDQDATLLSQSGAYTLTVSSTGSGFVPYQFTLIDVPAPVTTPTAIENVVVGSLTVPGQKALYSFSGLAGQNVYFDVANTNTFAFNWSLKAPNGSVLFNDGFMGDRDSITLPATGTYVITVDGNGASVGGFQFQLRDVPAPTTTAIQLEQVVSGGTTVPDQKQRFTFGGTAGQSIYFDVQNTNIFGFNWRVDNPDGSNLFNSPGLMSDVGPISLPLTGQYTITVDGSGEFVGSFQFQTRVVPTATTTPIQIGQLVSGAITVPGQFNNYTFTATAGQRVYFDVQGLDFNLNWKVLAPSGTVVFNAGFLQDIGPLTLPEGGPYTLVVDGNDDTVRGYSFQVVDLPFLPSTNIVLDQVVSSRISLPGEVDTYSFAGQAGQLVYFDAQVGSLFNMTWQLRDPSGNVVFGSAFQDRNTAALPATGTYTLTIDDEGDRVEDYRFQIATLDPINFGQVVTGNLRETGKVEYYRFDAVAGSPLSLDIIANESNNLRWNLISPSGNFLLGNVSIDVNNFTLPEAGTYTLAVSGQSPAAFGSYNFQLVQAATVPVNPPAGANLIVSNISAPARVIANPATLNVSWTVANVGDAAVSSGSWRDLVILSTDNIFGNSDDFIAGEFSRTGNLAIAQTYTRNETITLPAGFEGEFILGVRVDGANQIYEAAAEGDNGLGSNGLTTVFAAASAAGQVVALDQQSGDVYPAGSTVTLSGRAELRSASANIVIMLDMSPAAANTGIDANLDGSVDANDNFNGDNRLAEVLDAEIFAAIRLAQKLSTQVDDVRLTVIPFASTAVPMDLSSSTAAQISIAPRLAGKLADLEAALRTLSLTNPFLQANVGQFTSYDLGVGASYRQAFSQLDTVLDRLLPMDQTEVYMLSSGVIVPGQEATPEQLAAISARGINFRALQLGGTTLSSSMQSMAAAIDASKSSSGAAKLVSTLADLDQATITKREVVGLLVNGQPVAAFDAATRNFFAPVPVALGDNNLTISVVDSTGETRDFPLTLVGRAPSSAIDFTTLVDITPRGNLNYASTTFNRTNNQLSVGVSLQNVDTQLSLAAPVVAVVDAISPQTVNLLTRDGVAPNGKPYLLFDTEIAASGLASNAQSSSLPLRFEDINRDRFAVGAHLFAPANSRPFFSSAPVLVAAIGSNYVYNVLATDADLDNLTYKLLSPPTGMTINTNTGVISWLPSAIQSGSHAVTVEVTDGRSPAITQSFTVTAIASAANHPPVFSSQPVTGFNLLANPASAYTYDADAIDPDNDTVAYSLSAAPTGMTINSTSGLISWPAANVVAGSYNVSVVATDSRGLTTTQSYVLSITNAALGSISGLKFNDINANGIRNVIFTDNGGGNTGGTLSPIGLTQISTAFNTPVGIDYHAPTDSVIVSVYYDGGVPRNFERILADGTHVPFTNISNLTDEVKIATVKTGSIGGFTTGDLFTGNGIDGQIIRITNNGQTVYNPWVDLPGSNNGLMRGSLFIDDVGTFDGDLVVVTTAGEVWRINAFGIPTRLANVQTHLEGAVIVPNNPVRYGPLAGRLIAGAEDQGRMYSFGPDGSTTSYAFGVEIEDIDMIPAGQNFFGVNFGTSRILGAPASDFQSMVGDILLTQEDLNGTTGLFRLTWNGTTLVSEQINLKAGSAAVGQWEHVTFAPAALAEIPGGQLEPGLANWIVYIDANENGQRDSGERFTTTDASGNYQFTGLAAGTYVVREEYQAGWTVTRPVEGGRTVVVAAGATVEGINFGNTSAALTNRAPSLIGDAPGTIQVGQLYRYQAVAQDPDGDNLTYSLPLKPTGMTIDAATGLIRWVPTEVHLGTQLVTIEVSDGRGGLDRATFAISVTSPQSGPVITSTPTRIASVGQAYQYPVTAVDPQGDTITYSLIAPPTGMTIHPQTGLLSWPASSLIVGSYTIQIAATDTSGAAGYQTYQLAVRPANTAPQFTSSPVVTIGLANYYNYNADAIDAEDGITYSLAVAPAGMKIDAQTGLVSWEVFSLSQVGNHSVTIRATDDRGLFNDQPYTLTVQPDTVAPSVFLSFSKNPINIGEAVTVTVRAADNFAIGSVTLTRGGVPLVLDANRQVTFTPTAVGFNFLRATATDTSGNSAQSDGVLSILDPSDTTAPVVDINAPAGGAAVTYLTDILATISDANVESYVLEYSKLNTEVWTTLSTASVLTGGALVVNNTKVGVFDPTLLDNDQYLLRLTARDINGLSASDQIVLSVLGNAKIGVLQIPSTEECEACNAADLTIPVAGGPAIMVTREFSTLTADESGSFGNGWQYCMAEPRIRETVARTPFEDLLGQFAALAFREGDKVYITTPSCERVSFTFSPKPHVGIWSTVGNGFYDPRWIPDPGNDWQLYGENDFTQLTGIDSGEFSLSGLPLPLLRYADNQYILAALSASYNPLGYQLIGKDGTRYHYSQTEGLLDVTDTHGSKLTYSDTGIVSSSGQAVQFQRDDAGRITKVRDPDGRETLYTYNAAGDLVSVVYPNGLSNVYQYTAQHYLSAINADNTQQETIERGFEYDVAGRLSATLNSFGYRNTQTYDLANRTQTNFDALGNPTIMRYDVRGNMIYEKSPQGDEAFYEYDANDNRTVVTDELGKRSLFTYDDRRNVTSVTDAEGNVTLFQYDAANNVIYQKDARGGEYFYVYNAKRDMLEASQPGGGHSMLTYDALGRLITVTDVDGRLRRYEYGATAMPVRAIERDGSSVSMSYNVQGHLLQYTDELGRIMTVTYDERERPTVITDALGGKVRLFYDGRQLTKITDTLGNETRYVLDSESRPIQIIHPDGGVHQFEYDANGRRTLSIDPNGNRTSYSYRTDGRMQSMTDAKSGVTSYTYDATGRQTSVTYPNGNQWRVEYDAIGYVTAEIDPLGRRTSLSYDEMGNLISSKDQLLRETTYEYNSIQRPTKITNPAGGTAEMTYAWDGRLLTEKDALGRILTYTYDPRNRLKTATDPRNGVVQYDYDLVGNRTKITDERNNATSVTYDVLNHVSKIVDATGAETRYTFDTENQLTQTIDATGTPRSFAYDSMGRLSSTTDVLTGVRSWTYDLVGNVLTSQDELNRRTTYAYDELNRRTTVTDPLNAINRFTYDANGNLKSLRDAANNLTQFNYDTLDRLVERIDPLGRNSTLSYDEVGNLKQSVDRNGRTRSFDYDLLNRLTTETWKTGAVTNNTLLYGYDAVGNMLSSSDSFSSYTMTYDTLNRLDTVSNSGTLGAPTVVLNSTYDAASNRTQVSDQTGVSVASTYDNRNLLSTRQWSGGGVSAARADFTYDPRGLLSSLTRYGSLDTSVLVGSSVMTHDAKGRLEHLTHKGSAGQILVDYSYTRDLADQLTEETHHGATRTYTRDALGQLTGSKLNGVDVETYTYDLQGNRTSAASVTGADNRLLENATHTFVYDDEGNLIRKTDKVSGEVTEYTYDHRNRLTTSTRKSSTGVVLNTVVNTYDTFDRRIGRTVDSDGAGLQAATTVRTVYDGEHAWADYTTSGTVIARYLVGDQTDQLLARWRPSDGTAWYLTDRQGTVRDLANSVGSIVNTIEYDGFGRIISQTNAAVGDRFTYTGREWDADIGMLYYRARFYDATTGRFASQDPLGFAGGDANLYRYVGNNPVDFVDPSGMLAITECAFVRGATTILNVACPVLQMSLRGDLASDDIDQQIENTFQLMNIAFGTLPFGSSMALQLVMKAITLTTTAQALASMNVNEQLFNIMGMAETYAREAYRLFNQDGSKTFQEVMTAYSKVENKALFWSEIACGAANMALMVYSAKARCFVEGTPVVVGILPPEDAAHLAGRADDFGISMFDVLAGVALGGVIIMKRRQRREEKEAAMREQVDSVFGQWESEDQRDELQAAELTDSVSANAAATVVPVREKLHVEHRPTESSRVVLSDRAEVNISTVDKCETTTGPNMRWKRWLSGIAIFGLMLMAVVCSLPRLSELLGDKTAQATVTSTASSGAKPRPRLLTKPIEEIRCGDRIPSQLPEGLLPEDEPEPDPRTWRLVELELTKANGDKVEVKLLRPLAWLEQAGAITEGTFPVNVQELDIEGEAAVLKILPCPEIEEGEGQVVTGTFRHVCDSLVALYFDARTEPIICTSAHAIWSEQAQNFVSAFNLQIGEVLRAASGDLVKLEKKNRIDRNAVVCNLEVSSTHVYQVGTDGILVHNATGLLADCEQTGARGKRLYDDVSRQRLFKMNLNRGTKELEALGLSRRTNARGGYDFVDSTGMVRVRYDVGTQGWDDHWHKFYRDESGNIFRLNDRGYVESFMGDLLDDILKKSPRIHIPAG